MTRALIISFALLSTALLGGEAEYDFGGEALPLKSVESAEGLFSRVDGEWRFCADGIDTGKYRWGYLGVPGALKGDFSAEYEVRAVRLNRWTNYGAVLQDGGANSLRFDLANTDKGKVLSIRWEVDKQKKKEVAAICPDVSGTLAFRRDGASFAVEFRPSRGGEPARVVMDEVDFPSSARLSLSFGAAKGTLCDIRPRKLVLKGEMVELSMQTPPAPGQKTGPAPAAAPAAAGAGAGAAKPAPTNPQAPRAVEIRPVLLARENIEGDGAALVLFPGGRAVFAAELPFNFYEPYLRFRADGPSRVSVTQLGLSESLALGEARTFKPKPDAAKPGAPVDCSWELHHIRNRYASLRKWPLPRASNDTIPFFVLSAIGDAPVAVSDLRVTGKIAAPSSPPPANLVLPVAAVERDDGYITLAWTNTPHPYPLPQAESGTPAAASPREIIEALLAREKPFALDYSGERTVDGVPFAARPLFLSDADVVSVPVGRPAGEFHFLHVAGDSKGRPPWIATYRLIYDDGDVEEIHVVNRWNCGSFGGGLRDPLDGDFTWWGPTGFAKADVVYLTRPPNGQHWNALYHARYRNPHPEKTVREIRVDVQPRQTFALAALTLRAPAQSVAGLVEPARAVFDAGSALPVAVFEYSALPRATEETRGLEFVKNARRAKGGEVALRRDGRLGAGFAALAVPDAPEWTGPVVIEDGLSRSSSLGLMPAPAPGDRPFYFDMIMRGAESADQCEWVRRLGYDAGIIHSSFWKDDPEVWKERLETFAGAGLSVRIRPHGPIKFKTPQRVAYYRFDDGSSGVIEDGSVFDPADPATRAEVVARQVRFAEMGKNYPAIISQGTNYLSQQGLQPLSNLSRLYCGPVLWGQLLERLKEKYTRAEFARLTGLEDFDRLDLSFVAQQPSAEFLTELVRLSVEANSSLQREISAAVHAVNPRLLQVFHAGFRFPEHMFGGRTMPEYLRIGRDVAEVAVGNAAAERYWSSFQQWMAGARTFGFDHADEICANPPPYEHARLAFMWMAAFQSRESSYCRFSVGRPAGQNLADMKPFHQMLYNAAYLPDPVALAHSFRSAYADVPVAGRQARHRSQLAAYSLINAMRALNINPDRYLLDDFPEMDGNFKGKLLIDDCNHDIPDDFAERIERFVRDGGVYLASNDTDSLNGGRILARFGIERGGDGGGYSGEDLSCKEGVRRVYSKNVGQGRVVVMDASWKAGQFSYDIGYESPEYRALLAELLCGYGDFRPRARVDAPAVCVIPYLAKDGSVLVYAINLAGVGQTATVGLSSRTLEKAARVLDHRGGGVTVPVTSEDLYHETRVFIPPLSATVLRFE